MYEVFKISEIDWIFIFKWNNVLLSLLFCQDNDPLYLLQKINTNLLWYDWYGSTLSVKPDRNLWTWGLKWRISSLNTVAGSITLRVSHMLFVGQARKLKISVSVKSGTYLSDRLTVTLEFQYDFYIATFVFIFSTHW